MSNDSQDEYPEVDEDKLSVLILLLKIVIILRLDKCQANNKNTMMSKKKMNQWIPNKKNLFNN